MVTLPITLIHGNHACIMLLLTHRILERNGKMVLDKEVRIANHNK
jgi:hypothetical protein